MKILITGHNGFLGSHLITKLSSKYEIVGISKEKSAHKIPQIQTDITKISYEKIPKDVQCVIHLAAISDLDYCQHHPQKSTKVNVMGTQKMLEISRKLNSRFLFLSSSHVYGIPQKLPIKEEHPKNPTSIYGANKLAAEALCYTYSQSHGLDTTILRLFSVYGPNSPTHLVTNRIISQLISSNKIELGNLHTKRDFIYVDDVVRAIEISIKNMNKFNVFNVGSEKSHSILEICNMLEEITGQNFEIKSIKSKMRQNDIPDIVSDSTKLKHLSWTPKITLKEGLTLTVNWYRKIT